MGRFLFLALVIFCSIDCIAQADVVSGTVLDNTRKIYVEGVRVLSTSRHLAFTDSLGRYSIPAAKGDSIFFVYNNKPTQKFAVSGINNIAQFDISLPVSVTSKYTVLKEVTVFSKNYRQDSIENRDTYDKIFDYRKPGISTSVSPGGGVGLDINEFINMFRFKRNRRLKGFQMRLEEQEQEKYVNYRFNKTVVGRITQLQSPSLDSFLIWYRPSYQFVSAAGELIFTQYVLDSYYRFQKLGGIGEAKKEE